jgi:hypothetical protein
MLSIIAVVLTGWGRNTLCNAVLCKATCSTRLLLAACLDLTSFFLGYVTHAPVWFSHLPPHKLYVTTFATANFHKPP